MFSETDTPIESTAAGEPAGEPDVIFAAIAAHKAALAVYDAGEDEDSTNDHGLWHQATCVAEAPARGHTVGRLAPVVRRPDVCSLGLRQFVQAPSSQRSASRRERAASGDRRSSDARRGAMMPPR